MYHYHNICWNCGKEVNSEDNVRCRVDNCKWYICNNCYSCSKDCIGQENELLVKGAKAFRSYGIIKPTDKQLDDYIIIFHKIEKTNNSLNSIKQSGLIYSFILREPEYFVLNSCLSVEEYINTASRVIQYGEILLPTTILSEINQTEKFEKFEIRGIDYFIGKREKEVQEYLEDSKRMHIIYDKIRESNNIMNYIKKENPNIKFSVLSVEALFYKSNKEFEKYVIVLEAWINNFNIYNSESIKINKKLEKCNKQSVNFVYQERKGAYFLDKKKSEFLRYVNNAKLIMDIEDIIKNLNSHIYFKYPELKKYLRNAQSFLTEDKFDREEINKEVNEYMTMLYKLIKDRK